MARQVDGEFEKLCLLAGQKGLNREARKQLQRAKSQEQEPFAISVRCSKAIERNRSTPAQGRLDKSFSTAC